MLEKIAYSIRCMFKQPFKIGLISYYYPTNKQMNNGVALHTLYLSQELAKRGCEVHIFTQTEKRYSKTRYIGIGKIVIHGINTEAGPSNAEATVKKRINYFIFDHKIIGEVSREHKKAPFDTIHTHGWLTSGAFISKYLNNIPWIHTFHALEKNRLKFMTKEEKKYTQIARWIEGTINSADAVISVSKDLEKEAVKEYSIQKHKSFKIPNGVDRDVFYVDDTKIRKKQVTYIGRFSLEKGIDFLPNIIQTILDANEEYSFVAIASDDKIPESLDSTRKQFEYLIETYKDRFTWIRKPISPKEISNIYNESMIYIQPSRYESFGMTVLEAMSCGCVPVTSNRGGIPEVVGTAGEPIPLNIKLFGKKVIRLLEDHRLRERYSRKAVERSKEFSWDKITTRVFDIYDSLSKNKIKNKKGDSHIGETIQNLERTSGIGNK